MDEFRQNKQAYVDYVLHRRQNHLNLTDTVVTAVV
jgi:hypothetical protein